jgi:molecular chaperone GrpE
MNDSTLQTELPAESSIRDAPPGDEPRFGAVDIVEAFTAMRHEWRGQTKESRALAEQVEATVTSLQSLESKLLACVAENRVDDLAESRKLVLLIVETDHQLSRAIAAIAQWDVNRRFREEADAKAVQRFFEGMGRVARWFACALMTFVAEQRAAQKPAGENPALEGLSLVLARLRRAMYEQGIERIETLGRLFDAETMHAIGTVASADCPHGHVAEQLSPAYRWQGRLLRFADVRVAES